ncbi:MAG: GIY-YIG nuclease family protein [Saprospiraceae bacterium]|nr:GIY-YIG nuclease family protein [Saprospiraceae bacterium]
MWFVYILMCRDKKLYTGCTANLEDRLHRHESGWVPATKARLPIEMIFYIAIPNKYKAFELEKYFKSGSGRAFISKHFVKEN